MTIEFHGTAFVADTARVVGRVTLGKGASVWYGSVLRGDDAAIVVGENVNVQDLSVLHPNVGVDLEVGDHVSIGHAAVVHCARVGARTLVGIGSRLLAGSVIGEGCLIGAGALVPEGKVIPPRSVVLGLPGKIVRQTTDAEVEAHVQLALKYAAEARKRALEDAARRGGPRS
jgi:carbonic anhydrase/acetyltransferase-like protein (isoleucine patch superfamily)